MQGSEQARMHGKYEPAIELLRLTLYLTRQTGALEQRLRATGMIGWLLAQTFRGDEAIALLEPALDEAAGVDERTIASLKLWLVRAYFVNRGADPARMAESLEDVLQIAERRGLLDILALALIAKSNILLALGRRREGTGLLTVAYNIGRDNDLADVTIRAGNNLASMLTESDLAASIDLHVELMAMARRVGRLDGLLSLTSNFGYSAFLAGRWDAAMEAMEPVLAGEMSDRERMVMLNNAIIVRVNRGEMIDDDLALLRKLAHKMQGAQPEMFLADPEANSALSNGELQTASARFLVIADDDPSQMPEYAYRAARPMLWAGDIEAARAYYDKVSERGAFSPVA